MAIRFWTFSICILAFVLFSILILQMLNETGLANSYALLSEGFIKGEFSTSTECFDSDCITLLGKTYVIFPPFPAFITLPFIAIFGLQFSGYIAISVILFLASGFTWWAIARKLGNEKIVTLFFVIAILFSSPLFFVIIRGDRVWFFAQAVSFFSLSLALYFVLVKTKNYKSAILAGVLIGFSFLSRQMTILIAPFIFALLIEDDLPLFTINRDRLLKFISMAIPIALAIAIYFIYNYLRFGSILDTGYQYLAFDSTSGVSFMNSRIVDLGIFNSEFLLFNVFYLLFQGFHVEFVGQYISAFGSVDGNGTALLAASPFLFFLAMTPLAKKLQNNDRTVFSLRVIIIGVIVSLIMAGIVLFYHSNGLNQYNVQRYTLDWLPIAFVVLATALRKEYIALFGALISYGIVLNIVTMAVLFLVN